jgi:hypothetical protein
MESEIVSFMADFSIAKSGFLKAVFQQKNDNAILCKSRLELILRAVSMVCARRRLMSLSPGCPELDQGCFFSPAEASGGVEFFE